MKKIIWLILSFLLAACGGPQQAYFVPATEALVLGNSNFCNSKLEMSVTKINEDTVEIQANCVTTNSDGPNTINWTMNFEVLKNQEIFELVNNVHYGWGITLDDNNELLQIYEGGGSNGLVHIHWPPQVLQEE